ncbi:MAG TPA: DUF4038 domain-containing protein [Clostridiales bacterium]|nr:DUF4038 domain-containing protein [Clostridiales bacterium]
MPEKRYAMQNVAAEWGYMSAKAYGDPFNEIELDIVFTNDSGKTWRVPAYWAGDNEWRVRFAAPETGVYEYRTVCSDEDNASLNNIKGTLYVRPYQGNNPLYQHGPLKISGNKRYFMHQDGTPFFWLGDTWWFGLSKKLKWPEEFQMLTADRKQKGFTVIQLVAGFYPDTPKFEINADKWNDFSWEPGYKRINPAYFDEMDLRIQWLVRSGIVPCIFGSWGYHIRWTGLEAMKKHWRYVIARYGAYPVVWCIAGEGRAPFYLSDNPERDEAIQKHEWSEMGRFIRRIDPYHHPMTIHTRHYSTSREEVDDISLLDFDLPQAGQGNYSHISDAAKLISEAVLRKPTLPVVNGEVLYEGTFESCSAEIQRFVFWSAMLSGAAGHTYGANGLWQFNRKEDMLPALPGSASWGEILWEDAYKFPGSSQVGYGRQLLEKYEWWKLEPRQDYVEPSAGGDNYALPYAAEIPGKVQIYYFPGPVHPWSPPIFIKGMQHGSKYNAYFYDPKSGRQYPLGEVEPGSDNRWKLPLPPVMHDWVLVLEKKVY